MRLADAILDASTKHGYQQPALCLAMTHRERTFQDPRRRARETKTALRSYVALHCGQA